MVKRGTYRFMMFFWLLVSYALAPSTSSAINLYVDISTGSDLNSGLDWASPLKSISEALFRSFPDDIIHVAEGVYFENIMLKDRVYLIGGYSTGGSSHDPTVYVTVIDGQYLDSVITGAQDSTIDGFNITRGSGYYKNTYYYGGGIFCSGIRMVIQNCTIRDNLADFGAGMYAEYSTLVVSNNVFFNNMASYGGGGFYGDTDYSTISGNKFYTGNAFYGAGIALEFSSTTFLQDNIFAWNYSVTHGGGITVWSLSDPIIKNNRIINNSAEYGGGISVLNSYPEIYNTVIVKNVANVKGGGIYAGTDSLPVFINDTIADNLGQGIACDSISLLLMKNSIMWNNEGSFLQCLGSENVTYSDLEEIITGTGNMSTDPLFVSPSIDDYRLQCGSPAIDAGDPASGYSLEPIPNGSRINMGAYGNTSDATKSLDCTPIVQYTPSPTFTPTPTYTNSPTVTPTHTISPTVTSTFTLVPTYTPYPTFTPQPTPTPMPTYTPIPTFTPFPTFTPTTTPTLTPTNSPTRTPTSTPTNSPTLVPTYTPQPTYTSLLTYTPQPTYTPRPTYTPYPTFTYTPTISPTPTNTYSPFFTPTNTPTNTPLLLPVMDSMKYTGLIFLICWCFIAFRNIRIKA